MEAHDTKHLAVAVLTTSGRWPETGFEKASPNEKVRHVLKQAARALDLASTDDWIATVAGTALNQDNSFAENGFGTGQVVIDFGPRQGGGGRA
jgi:hypothetical protein